MKNINNPQPLKEQLKEAIFDLINSIENELNNQQVKSFIIDEITTLSQNKMKGISILINKIKGE